MQIEFHISADYGIQSLGDNDHESYGDSDYESYGESDHDSDSDSDHESYGESDSDSDHESDSDSDHESYGESDLENLPNWLQLSESEFEDSGASEGMGGSDVEDGENYGLDQDGGSGLQDNMEQGAQETVQRSPVRSYSDNLGIRQMQLFSESLEINYDIPVAYNRRASAGHGDPITTNIASSHHYFARGGGYNVRLEDLAGGSEDNNINIGIEASRDF